MITLRGNDSQHAIVLEAMTADGARVLGEGFAVIDPWARYPFPASALERYLGTVESNAPRYAIRVGGATAGAIGTRDGWLRGPYLQFLGILPAFQNLGIGGLALLWFEDAARAKGERNIWVAASDFNSAGLRFYERHGFERAAVLDDLVSDGVSEVLLRKRLAVKSASHK